MPGKEAILIREYLRHARQVAGLTQTRLAAEARVDRVKIVRAEAGKYIPNLGEAERIARTLGIPLQQLTTGRKRPAYGLRGIALELSELGISDLNIVDPIVPGAFRRREQVLALALRRNQPEPRIIEALPYVLATRLFDVPLAIAFADLYDKRIRGRLAWLCDITLMIDRQQQAPFSIKSTAQLEQFIRAAKPRKRPDSLGSPTSEKTSPIWSRWNITYSGTLEGFRNRVHEVARADKRRGESEGPDDE